MTQPGPATLKREKDKLWVSDIELIRRLGVPEKVARSVIAMLDKDPSKTGFPQRSKLWGGRRYYPAVKAWLDRTNGLNVELPQQRRQA